METPSFQKISTNNNIYYTVPLLFSIFDINWILVCGLKRTSLDYFYMAKNSLIKNFKIETENIGLRSSLLREIQFTTLLQVSI